VKPKRLFTGLAGAAVLALAVVAVALAHGTSKTELKATLTPGQEVPKQAVKAPGGSGTFVATLGGSKLSWKLTFRRLSGPAVAAHVHLGRPGKAGGVAVSLCGPCRTGVSGNATLTSAQVKAILRGGAYVNVHTAKNPNGEIRGQVTKGGAGGGSTTPPPAPTTTTSTTTTSTTGYGY
jgi:CHRD domain